jgi:preprotein translocase subunit SecG
MAFFITSLGLSFVGLRNSVADTIADQAATPASTTPSPTGTAPVPAEAAPSSPKEAAPTPTPAGEKGSANDAVPAEKLPAK